VIGAGLAALGIAVALFVARHYTGSPEYYQAEFGPAVMVALGRGFVDPVVVRGSALDDFLHRRRVSLAPRDVDAVVARPTPNILQESSRYLMLAVGWWWKVSGISWSAVWGLTALLYGMAAAAYYGLFRVWLPRSLAVVGALFLCFAPVQLEQMPHVRDYSKVPFLVAALALVSVAALRPLSRRALAAVSVACGAVVGLGFGFRPDMEIVIPIFLLSVAVFARTDVIDKALAAALFLLAFLIVSGPVLFRVWGAGSNQYHVFLLGFTEPFEGTLRIRPSVYGFGLVYSDQYVEQTVSAESERIAGRPAVRPSSEYNEASQRYWLRIVRHFPADLTTRIIAAASGILNLPFQNRVPDFLDASLPGAALTAPVFGLLRRFDDFGLAVGVLLVAIAAGASWRHAAFAAAQMIALFAVAALEFERRHVFYLQFIPALALLLAAFVAWRWTRGARPSVLRPMIAAVVIAVATAGCVESTRLYQSSHLKRMFLDYIGAPTIAVSPTLTAATPDVWLARWPKMEGDGRGDTPRSHAYYAVDFEWPRDPALVAIGLRYRTRLPPDLSSVVTLRAAEGTNRIFLPVYNDPRDITFEGLELPPSLAAGIRISRVDESARALMPLDLRLASDWSSEGLYETLRQERSRFAHDLRFVDSIDRVSRIGWLGRLAAPATRPQPDAVAERYTDAVVVTTNGIEMNAPVDGVSSRLLRLKPVRLSKGGALIAHGRLDSGGLAVGLLQGDKWHRRTEITEAGTFVAILELPDAGCYTPVITNAAPKDRWRNRFVIYRFGVVEK